MWFYLTIAAFQPKSDRSIDGHMLAKWSRPTHCTPQSATRKRRWLQYCCSVGCPALMEGPEPAPHRPRYSIAPQRAAGIQLWLCDVLCVMELKVKWSLASYLVSFSRSSSKKSGRGEVLGAAASDTAAESWSSQRGHWCSAHEAEGKAEKYIGEA